MAVQRQTPRSPRTASPSNSGIIERSADGRSEEEDHRRAGSTRRRPRHRELPSARLGVLAPALLGRAHPDHPLRDPRRRGRAGGGPAGDAARRRALRPHRHRRIAAGRDRGLGAHHLPHLRRTRRAARPTPCRSGRARAGTTCATSTRRTRNAPGRSCRREAVDAGRPVRGRRRACRLAPAVRALLAQGAVRPGHRDDQGAVQEAAPPGHGARVLVPGRDGPVSRARARSSGATTSPC